LLIRLIINSRGRLRSSPWSWTGPPQISRKCREMWTPFPHWGNSKGISPRNTYRKWGRRAI